MKIFARNLGGQFASELGGQFNRCVHTIQIHRLNLTDVSGNPILDENGNIVYTDLVSLAIWIPETIGKDIIRQPENI